MDSQEQELVGPRIRALRKQQGLSLRALAERSGLSRNAISLIERGENSPTVSSLVQLASALEVPIVAFFQEQAEELVVFVKRGQRLKSLANSTSIESLATGLAEQRLEPFLVTIEPGGGPSAETYAHPGEEFVHCLQGALEYRVGDRLYQVEAGDSLLFKASQTHGFHNAGDSKAIALIIIDEREPSNEERLPAAHHPLH